MNYDTTLSQEGVFQPTNNSGSWQWPKSEIRKHKISFPDNRPAPSNRHFCDGGKLLYSVLFSAVATSHMLLTSTGNVSGATEKLILKLSLYLNINSHIRMAPLLDSRATECREDVLISLTSHLKERSKPNSLKRMA